jgi:hypothetical protein
MARNAEWIKGLMGTGNFFFSRSDFPAGILSISG